MIIQNGFAVEPLPRFLRLPNSQGKREVAHARRQTRAQSGRKRATRNGHNLAYVYIRQVTVAGIHVMNDLYKWVRARARECQICPLYSVYREDSSYFTR